MELKLARLALVFVIISAAAWAAQKKKKCELAPLASEATGFPTLATEEERKQSRAERVDAAAREFFPGGTLIPADDEAAVAATKSAIAKGDLTLYRAAFQVGDDVMHADILHRESADAPWSLTLVSSSTSAKPEKHAILARKLLQLKAAGIEVTDQAILHLNGDYRSDGKDPLFIHVDVTKKVEEKLKGKTLADFKNSADEQEAEDAKPQVSELSVLHVPWIHYAKRKQLLESGITDFAAVIENRDSLGLKERPTDEQIKLLEHAIAGKRYVDVPVMKRELQTWDLKHPLVFLDFETLDRIIPIHPNAKPGQQVPFQFSVQVGKKRSAYLHDKETDPRPKLIAALIKAVPAEGSIVAYYKPFEESRLKEMAEAFPEHAEPLLAIAKRLVDPLPILRASFYDKAQAGSYSLKAIAPAVLGASSSYKGMAVSDGLMAQSAFETLISGRLSAEQKKALKSAMKEYCEKDTDEVAGVVEWMLKTTGLK